MEGGLDGTMTFCLRPGMEGIRSVTDIPAASTRMRYPQIAAQCCTSDNQCRRTPIWGQSNANRGCVAGTSSNVAPHITQMTYAESVGMCASLGLQLCAQSCKGTGCNYNRYPVFTNLPCPAAPSPPPPSPPSPSPPSGTRPPPPSPPSPSPAPPVIEYARWGASRVGELFKTPDESDANFIQHCLSLCAAAGTSACVGFSDTTCGASATRCCRFSTVSTTNSAQSFFLTSDTTYVRTQLASAVPSSAGSPAALETSALSAGVIINPWDDSYEGEGPAGNGTGGQGTDTNTRVEADQVSLSDWRVVLLTISAFVVGILVAILASGRRVPSTLVCVPNHTGPPPKPPPGSPPPDAKSRGLWRHEGLGTVRDASGAKKVDEDPQAVSHRQDEAV